MRTRLALIPLLVVAACGPARRGAGPATPARPATPPGTLVLVSRLAPVGQVTRHRSSVQVELAVTADGATKHVRNVETDAYTTEVLARDGAVVTKRRIRFEVKTEAREEDGDRKPVVESPIQGKTFVLERRDGRTVVTDEAGRPLEPQLAARVLKEQAEFGKPDEWHVTLPGEPLRVGARVPALEAALRRQFSTVEKDEDGQEQRYEVDRATLALDQVRTEAGVPVGVFAVTLHTRVLQAGQPFMSLVLTGSVVLRARDGWPVRLELSGPMTVVGQPATGRMTISASYAYSPARP